MRLPASGCCLAGPEFLRGTSHSVMDRRPSLQSIRPRDMCMSIASEWPNCGLSTASGWRMAGGTDLSAARSAHHPRSEASSRKRAGFEQRRPADLCLAARKTAHAGHRGGLPDQAPGAAGPLPRLYQALIHKGIALVSFGYRIKKAGNPGKDPGVTDEDVGDALAVMDYVCRCMGVPKNRVVMFGART